MYILHLKLYFRLDYTSKRSRKRISIAFRFAKLIHMKNEQICIDKTVEARELRCQGRVRHKSLRKVSTWHFFSIFTKFWWPTVLKCLLTFGKFLLKRRRHCSTCNPRLASFHSSNEAFFEKSFVSETSET